VSDRLFEQAREHTAPRTGLFFLSLLFLLWGGAAAFLLIKRAPVAASVEKPAALLFAACDGEATQVEAEITSELRLAEALLSASGARAASEQAIEAAIALQLRYLFSALQNQVEEADDEDLPLLTPAAAPPQIEILEQRAATYGQNIALAWPGASANQDFAPQSAYVQHALARKQLRADDPAIVVRYRARVHFARCARGHEKASLDFPVPRDPYLLYFSLPEAQRIEQVYGAARARAFPCASSEIAEFNHPEYLWYYFTLRRQTPDCQRLLEDAHALTAASLRIRRSIRPRGDLGALGEALRSGKSDPKQPLRVAAVFGYLDHQLPRPPVQEVADCLERGAACRFEESGVRQYVGFLRGLAADVSVQQTEFKARDAAVVATLFGTLRRSGQRIAITAYLTETDSLAPRPYVPRHAPLLLQSLGEAEIVLYAGHSGLGSNFSVAELARDAGPSAVTDALRKSPTRLIALIGCYTYSYFGRDLAAQFAELRAGAAPFFVYTGNAVAQTSASSAHVLATIDCLLAGGTSKQESCTLPAPGKKESPDFLIYEDAR
jgi:hypothetical protein